jgi:hypothetical protein
VERRRNITFGIKENGAKPPAEWMLNLLSTYNAGHPFFQKNFYPENIKARALV